MSAPDPVKAILAEETRTALQALGMQDPPTPEDLASWFERPPEADMGDYALPCFRFAKALKDKPQNIALKVQAALSNADQLSESGRSWINRVDVKGAFLNIFLNQTTLGASLLPASLTVAIFSLPPPLRKATK